ncbi:SEL1-like repeat protein [Thalassotalea crassostreae]|uniref:SEL1-like repeat protein n=1 Tax=Thalassotalea crassostreae TaxID=1763536 RepID=UPI0008A4A810|nr:SEL1-like repeat protein [Thalassotalea crassostreae]
MINLKNRTLTSAIALSFLISAVSYAGDVVLADKYYVEQQYDLALNEYLSVAEEVNAKAYYQLGTMYYKGLGTKADEFKALVWFSMAAEHNYDNSKDLVSKLLAGLSNEDREKVLTQIKSYQLSYAKQGTYRQNKPEIIINSLSKKVLFDGQPDLSEVDIITDYEYGSSSFSGNSAAPDIDQEDFSSFDSLGDENMIPFEQYFLIADYDVAADGSIRNIIPIQTSGDVRSALHSLSMNTLPKPTVEDDETQFINRTFLGLAAYNKLRMKNENNYFYVKLNRQIRELNQSEKPKDKYTQAMTLMIFPWLKQQKGDVDKLLRASAEQGFMKAQYEYGLKLYREQKEISDAVQWLYRAAKQGHRQAKYRLGRILLDSPWITKDEHKALFWLEEAASKGHIAATQTAIGVKLLATDEQLIDVNGAIDYLSQIEEQQNDNPEYNYLQAIAHLKMEPRQLSKSVEYIRTAIDLGDELNWDVAPWKAELKKWTSGGNVTISEVE